MPAPYCSIDESDPTASTAATAVTVGAGAGTGMDDDSPQPRLRGNFRGFLPNGTVDELTASVNSGSGLALMGAPPVASSGNALLWLLTIAGLLVATRRR
jgi:hypothetical protein